MAFCRINLSDPQIKEELEALTKKYGKASAYYILDARERANRAGEIRATINEAKAKAWLAERFPGMSVEFYDMAKQVGDGFVHGYVHNAGMKLWTAAESGTEYHEAYHVTFRTMLSDEQRQGLYEEARKQFGEPTADEIKNILSQFPNISEQEASNLVLEEKMAEEFREYVLTEEETGKGLLGKIAKWFKNLFNWIKAMVSDNLGLKQTYSLIQSNRMNKGVLNRKVFRNPQKFQGHDVAYMHRTEFTEREFIEVKDTLYTIFMDTKKNLGKDFNVSNAMGIEGDKGDIANGMLMRLYKKPDGGSVSLPEAKEMFDAEENFRLNKTNEAKANMISVFNKYNAIPASKFLKNEKNEDIGTLKENIAVRDMYANIYRTWNTTLDPVTGNVEKYGWRDILVEKLQDTGLKITGKDVTEYELQKDEQDMMEDELEVIDGLVEKIYGKSQLEDSPAKRLTGKVKELISTIKTGVKNRYGVDTYIDREVVYRELLELFTGKQSFSEMRVALENAAVYKPNVIRPIIEFVDGLEAPQKAMLFNAFALATTEFVLMKSREDGNKIFVDIFNPNRKGKAEKLADLWRREIIASPDPNSRGLYQEQIQDTGEEGVAPAIIYTPIESKIAEVKAAFAELEKIMPKRALGEIPMEPGVTHPLVKAVGDVMWAMGLSVGDNMNIQETYDNIHKIVSNGFFITDEKGSILPKKGEPAIAAIKGKLTALMAGINTPNFIASKKSVAIELANYFAPVLNIAGESFVDVSGAAKYATNTQSHMQEIVNELKNNKAAVIEKYMDDPFIGANGEKAFQSILFRNLINNPAFFEEFGIADLDGFKESDRVDDATTYEDISKLDSYVVRINAWINGGRNDVTRIFIPVQADRGKYTAMTVPRISKNPGKLSNASKAELIKAQIVQDFLRMAEAKKVILAGDKTLFIDGYHTDPKTGKTIEDGYFLGRAFDSKFMQFTALDENGKQIVTNEELTSPQAGVIERKFLSSVIEKYIKNELSAEEKQNVDERLDTMVSKLDTYMKNQAVKLKGILSEEITNKETHLDRIGKSSLQGIDIDQILEAFVFEETLMRNEIVKLFRGSRAYSKNLVDFYKRMGHLSSPGSKYALKSDNIGGVDWMPGEMYGMMNTYNEITLADLKLNATPAQVERAKKAAAEMEKSLIKAGVPVAQAVAIASSYLPESFDSTDAQAFISLEMHRGLMQGEGKWGEEEERAYRAYKITGEFVYQPGFAPKGFQAGDAVPVYPTKTYFEKLQKMGRSMVPISEKNSYSVLLKSYTKDFPQLDELRKRVESEGEDYAGAKPVHVVNFVTGKKLAKRNVHTVTGQKGEFANVVINVNDSRGLRKPQSIPEMKDNPVATFNRQIKKNMMANINKDVNARYTLNAGVAGEMDVTPQQLQSLYHSAIEEKLDRDMQDVMKELKIDDLKAVLGDENATPEAINKVKLDVLKNIRDIIYKQILDGDLHSNYYKALDIEIDATGKPKFKVPLDLPIYNKKFESIIMSVMNNRVFKQNMKGYEAVQVAQVGGHAIDNELKFYEIAESNGKQRLAHAEIMIREDLARQFGIKPGQSLDEVPEELRRIIGYRIPNQDKASTVILKIKAFLPENYAKSIVVPGQLVKLMGSDFDVDKLFLMFPEVQQDRESKWGIKKVMPNYKGILSTPGMISDPSKVSNKQLNNIILDSMEAVMSSPYHFVETLSPLDDKTLQKEVDRVREKLPEFDVAQDWNDVTTETDALIRNQAGNKLRGIYANIIAGRNVAQHGTVNLNKNYSIKIEDENGQVTEFDTYRTVTKEGITTDKSGSLFLSAAVDAGKDPIQLELNDSLITAPIRALFMAYHDEYNTRTCTNLLNQPYVRMLTSIVENKYGGDTRQIEQAKKQVIAVIRAEMAKRKAAAGDKTPVTTSDITKTSVMKASELENLSKENRDLNQQLLFVQNFALYYKAGKKLLDLYKRITPDSMDGLNRIGNIQSYNDKAATFDASIDSETGQGAETMFYGPDTNGNVIDQFVGENSVYGLERGYENLKNESLKVASVFFPMRTSAAFLNMKNRIKNGAGQKALTSAMHQQIDGNLSFLMLTKPGSPFLRYLEEKYATDMYANPSNNIGTRLNQLKKQFPKLAANKFVANFEMDTDTAKGYYGVKFDGSFAFSRAEREQFTAGLRAMMFTPQVFLNRNTEDVVIKDGVIQDPELRGQANAIRFLGDQLAMHSFLSNGFRQGASSYHDIVPIEFWSIGRKDSGGKSILDFLHDEGEKLANPNYFTTADLMTYMQLFGPMKAEGTPLLDRVNNRGLNKKTTALTSDKNKQFLVFRNKKTNEIGTFVNAGKDSGSGYRYVRIDSAFVGKTIYSLPNINVDERLAKAEAIIGYIDAYNDIQIPDVKDNDNLLACGQ